MKRLCGLVFLMVFFVSGCGGTATGKVSGKVTVNGKPLPSGMLILTPENGTGISAAIKDGAYSVDNVPVGKAIVAVREAPAPMTGPTDPSKPRPKPPPSVVPKKYEQPETSGLATTVAKGPNEFNIDLK